MIYLASPYNHADPAVREERYLSACRAAAKLMANELNVFSPIAHSHPIAVHGGLDAVDHDFWMRRDLPILRRCNAIMVLCLDGWEQSRGIRCELEEADRIHERLHKQGGLFPILYVTETVKQAKKWSFTICLDECIEILIAAFIAFYPILQPIKKETSK